MIENANSQTNLMSRYHCHTCKMVDGIGVCSICAKVCHADHDVTYSKYGSFFCDCGDKEDGSCKAMTRRSPQYSASSAGQQQERMAQQQPLRPDHGSQRSAVAGTNQLSNFGLDSILPRYDATQTLKPFFTCFLTPILFHSAR